MRNFIQPGDSLTLVAAAALTSGQGLLLGSLFGVVAETVSTGQIYTLVVAGVFDLPKAAAVTPAVGAKLYWDDTAKAVTTTVASNALIGVAAQAAAAADATVRVRLNGVSV